MPLPQVDREAVLKAISEFDETLRESPDFLNWEQSRAQRWFLEHESRLYPPKKIIAMATGAPVSSFSGGLETNQYLEQRGFQVRRLRDMSLRDLFNRVLERYLTLRTTQAFGRNEEARELFGEARTLLQGWINSAGLTNLQVVASYGKGNWAQVPWIAVLDRRETTTTQNGTYVVYLFHEAGNGVYLKLAQGVTVLEREHGADAFRMLQASAVEIGEQCRPLLQEGWDFSGKTDLGSGGRLARLYEASTAASKFYAKDAVPSDGELEKDLIELLKAYQAYVDERVKRDGATVDERPLALIGTWRSIDEELPRVRAAIQDRGGWASWWSFPIKDEALARLKTPFYLYAHQGGRRIAAKLRVDAMQTSRGNNGIESPWPEATDPELRSKVRTGNRQSEVFKTWFRIGTVERLIPALDVDELEIAVGLSTPESLLNQNTFGYVVDEGGTELTAQKVAEAPLIKKRDEDIEVLVERTGLPRAFLEEVVDVLLGSANPQIILAGPPGTSKTWLARELSNFVAARCAERVRLVQFHPNYSYESFIEGIRPVTKGGAVHFELTPGVVVKVVQEMRHQHLADVPGVDYVVVMDELNRANLPRVLGELMYAFEYRDQTVQLQYSGDFVLPKNLRFVGTMNTADRNIRSIDIALRRRFAVFELHPDYELLKRFHAQSGNPFGRQLAMGLERLNRMLIEVLDRHHTIGHAFFMRPGFDRDALALVWARQIHPLIEEFLFDQPERLVEFEIDRIWMPVA
ncbi:MAG TPA: DUF3578 domain-containing protein [Roseateles sp.]|uniref:MrcB family domain-containing protein n=1 Tax=Roseateles sp. TaxID=1971397 RepID=UPI002ED7AA50